LGISCFKFQVNLLAAEEKKGGGEAERRKGGGRGNATGWGIRCSNCLCAFFCYEERKGGKGKRGEEMKRVRHRSQRKKEEGRGGGRKGKKRRGLSVVLFLLTFSKRKKGGGRRKGVEGSAGVLWLGGKEGGGEKGEKRKKG